MPARFQAFLDWLTYVKPLQEFIGFLVVVIGLPIALITYIDAKAKERKEREYGTYNALDDRFVQFEKICLENPDLDVFDVPDAHPKVLDDTQKKKEVIIFTILFAIFERAYTMYKDQSTEFRRKQWSGWDDYIKQYCKRPNCRAAWKQSGQTFDTEFQGYMKGVMESVKPEGP